MVKELFPMIFGDSYWLRIRYDADHDIDRFTARTALVAITDFHDAI